MRYDITLHKHYLLVLDKSGSDKVGDWVLWKGHIFQIIETQYLEGNKKILSHYPLAQYPFLKGLPILPPFSRSQEGGVVQEARQYLQDKGFSGHANHSLVPKWMAEFYEIGRERHSLTLDKLIELYVEKTGYGMDMWSKEENETMSTIAEIIQSLQEPKPPVLPVAFEFEVERVCRLMSADIVEKEGWIKVENAKSTYTRVKTITNAEGITEWVGEYIFF
jgi:hypothetical protein